jgi:1-acyl-sn-glycerol-3-phosphate acyltransferase
MTFALCALRTVVAWFFAAIAWVSLLILHMLCFKRLPDRVFTGIARASGRITLAIVGIRLELLNESTVSDRAPRVLICNHQSGLDLLWGAAISPPRPLAIGKRELKYIPLVNLLWWGLDFIRIDRSDPARARATLQGVAQAIRRGSRTLVIAPEGTRSPDGTILPFKKGAFHIAIEAQVPICPVVVAGAFRLLPKGHFVIRPGTIRLRFLEPVPTAGLGVDAIDGLIARTRGAMLEAFEALSSRP